MSKDKPKPRNIAALEKLRIARQKEEEERKAYEADEENEDMAQEKINIVVDDNGTAVNIRKKSNIEENRTAISTFDDKAYPIRNFSKKNMPEMLNKGSKIGNTMMGVVYTPYPPLNPEGVANSQLFFEVAGGNDAELKPLKIIKDSTNPIELETITSHGKRFTALADGLDKMVDIMIPKDTVVGEQNNVRVTIRSDIGQDIINVASGQPPLLQYTKEQWQILAEFAAVIRVDKGRGVIGKECHAATPYIDSVVKNGEHSFKKRFGGKNPMYVGTGEMSIEQLRKKTPEKLREEHLIPEIVGKEIKQLKLESIKSYNEASIKKSDYSGPRRLKLVGQAFWNLKDNPELEEALGRKLKFDELGYVSDVDTDDRSHSTSPMRDIILPNMSGNFKPGKYFGKEESKGEYSDVLLSDNAFNRKEDISYWYQYEDISTIGHHLIKQLNQANIVYANPLGKEATQHDKEIDPSVKKIDTRSVEALKKFNDELNDGKKVVGVFNVGSNHWIAYTLFKKDDQIVCRYKDSLGKEYTEFAEAIQEAFEDYNVDVQAVNTNVEQDLNFEPMITGVKQHTNCGIFALKNMLKFAEADNIESIEFYNPGNSQEAYNVY